MADTKISALPAASSANSTDELPVNQAGTTRKATLAQVSSAIGTLGSGKVVQVVNFQTGAVATGSTIIPIDDTIPQNTEGDQYMTLAITPVSATNKLKIDVVFHANPSVAGWNIVALFQDSAANALAAAFVLSSFAVQGVMLSFRHYMTAGTTAATTFKVRAGLDRAGITTFNGSGGARYMGGTLASSITITEIIP